ncbi:TPA: TolC family protein, partial [Escherichia coli]
ISDYPSFYLSLGMMPKKGGALKDFSFKEMDYNASLGITFPLMRIFDTSENQKTQAMHISQIHNEYIRESIKLDILHKEIFTKLTLLKKRIPILEDELNLKKREVEYIHERIKSKQDTILNYLSSINSLYETETTIQRVEYDIEYYSLYLYFLRQCDTYKRHV